MSILFLFASLGVVNGLLVGVFLIVRKPRSVSDSYFGGLLLALSIRIGKSVFFYFSEEVDQLILQVGLSACVFIGPFFYLYAKSLRKNEQNFNPFDILILLVLLAAIVVVGVIFPYRIFPEIWNGSIIYWIYSFWILFTLLGLYQSVKLFKTKTTLANRIGASERYFGAIVVAVLFITTTYQIALFFGFAYIWGALTFSFTFYYLGGRAFLSRKSIAPKVLPPLENSAELLRQVDNLMDKEKLYMNQGLKLDLLAERVGMSKHLLSRVLNEEYEHGFSHYVKKHRVNEAKQLIHSRPELSLEGIGYEAGFSSKSAFFEAFKKIAHCTPAEFKKAGE
ncbi:MAG: helix-turn-helix domain-containing protein [Cyclobacteriaceae bacterium]